MSDNRTLFIEEAIIGAVKRLLTDRVNEILRNEEFNVPYIEFGNYQGEGTVTPAVTLNSCEKSEKERIIRLDAYTLTISFSIPEKIETETQCYAYTSAVCTTLKENPTLGGVAERAVVTGEKYVPPKIRNSGQEWQVIISLRVTVGGIV
jgi:hypothetical protein